MVFITSWRPRGFSNTIIRDISPSIESGYYTGGTIISPDLIDHDFPFYCRYVHILWIFALAIEKVRQLTYGAGETDGNEQIPTSHITIPNGINQFYLLAANSVARGSEFVTQYSLASLCCAIYHGIEASYWYRSVVCAWFMWVVSISR